MSGCVVASYSSLSGESEGALNPKLQSVHAGVKLTRLLGFRILGHLRQIKFNHTCCVFCGIGIIVATNCIGWLHPACNPLLNYGTKLRKYFNYANVSTTFLQLFSVHNTLALLPDSSELSAVKDPWSVVASTIPAICQSQLYRDDRNHD